LKSADDRVNELLSIVVPVYNEETTVRAVIERLLSIDLPIPREILVVNDGSTDGTRGVLDALPPAGEALRIVHAEVNGGKGRAIRTGFERARGTIVAIQDADLELDPAELAGSCSRFLPARPTSSTDHVSFTARRVRRWCRWRRIAFLRRSPTFCIVRN
jgi:glycosyltransferase involved in cell wall biosynthesis